MLWTVAGIGAIAAYLILSDEWVQDLLYDGLAFAAAGVVVAGIVLGRVRPAHPWWLLALGIALLGAGDIIWDILEVIGSTTEPSLADAAYLAGTLAICVAAGRLLLRKDGLLAGSLDAFMIGSAVSILLWTLVFDVQFESSFLASPQLITVAAYPALDVAMLSILVVAVMGGRPLDLPTALFGGAVMAFLANDLVYTVVSVGGEYESGLIDVGWLLGYVLWGAAALSSSTATRHIDVDRRVTLAWRSMRPVVRVVAVATPLLAAAADQMMHGHVHVLEALVVAFVVSTAVILRLELAVREKGRLLDDRHRLETTLQQQAMEDPLTELPNRRGFADRLVVALADPEAGTGLLILDLDDFKSVNDALGHQAGDELLQAVAARLRSAVRSTDTVARFGGDEFAVILTPCARADVATGLAQRLLDGLDGPISTERGQVSVSGSIGIALSDLSGRQAEDMLRDADLALYRAKSEGKHRWAVLDPETRAAALRSLSIASDLRPAVDGRQFELLYQPIVSLVDGGIEAMEALVRWNHPALGTLLASEFLPVAERSVHMPAIGRWTLQEACSAAAAWRRHGGRDIGVSVNISGSQLSDEEFPELVLGCLRQAGLPSGLLTLELLESSLDATPSVARHLQHLRDAGVRLAIDDFGTGYSSLSRVAELPVTELKLDRSLVVAGDERMMNAVVRMGQTLGLRLVAEGIERTAELELVRSLGYDAAQGYLLSRPRPAAEAARLIDSWVPSPDGGSEPGATVRVLASA